MMHHQKRLALMVCVALSTLVPASAQQMNPVSLHELLPAPAAAKFSLHQKDVLVGLPTPALVTVHWTVFRENAGAYITQYWAEVKTPVKGMTVSLGEHGDAINMGTTEKPLMAIPLNIVWDKSTRLKISQGAIQVLLKADGTLTETGPDTQ